MPLVPCLIYCQYDLVTPSTSRSESDASCSSDGFGYWYRGKHCPAPINPRSGIVINHEGGKCCFGSFTGDTDDSVFTQALWENTMHLSFSLCEYVVCVTICGNKWSIQNFSDIVFTKFSFSFSASVFRSRASSQLIELRSLITSSKVN